MTSTTRRISVTSEQLQNDTLRVQLFSACCAYGLVEWLRYEEDPNYNTTTVRLQFQKLSSADRLRSDMQQRGQAWQIEGEPATSCVGSDVLLSSPDVITCARLTSLLPTLRCTELAGVGGASGTAAAAIEPVPTATMATFEEKSFQLNGRGTTTTTTTTTAATSSGGSNMGRGSTGAGPASTTAATATTTTTTTTAATKVSAEQESALWAGFEQLSSALRHSCLGSYCAVLHLASAHDANQFLLEHQLTLAERHGVHAIHVGAAATSPLAAALPKMLARHALTSRPLEGWVVRGYVVAMPSNTYCVVDAGLYPSTEQAATATLVNTHTNFLSVSLGDEVQVQLSAGGGLSIAGEGMVGGKLLRVVAAAAFASRRSGAKAQLPTSGSRNSTAARGLLNAAAPHQQNSKTAAAPVNLAGVLRRGGGVKPMSGSAAKALASRLFQHIQETKRNNAGAGGDGASVERICTYPAGLSVYTRLLVRVEKIDDEGLHARCIADTDNCGYAGPVFIPAALVPAEATAATGSSGMVADHSNVGGGSSSSGGGGGGGDGWKSYAVVGERMHVALLYMVAVGGSAATMRGVASKREADLRRAAAPSLGPTDGDTSSSSAALLAAMGEGEGPSAVTAGTSVTAVAMLQFSEGDLGVPTGASPSRTFPAYLLRAGPHASAALRQTPLLLPVADLGPLDPSALITSPATLTISEVVNDVSRGQYAVVVPYAVYAARQAERAAVQEQRKRATVDEVKRRLAAVMGDDILEVLKKDEDRDAEESARIRRQRTEQ